MHALSLFLAPLLALAPLALSSPMPFALAEPALLPPTSYTCPCYPDNADDTYKGYQGPLNTQGFPSRIGCPSQSAQIQAGRIEDTIRRALGAAPVAAPANQGACATLGLPYYQGTVYIGSVQIFLAWNDALKTAHFCSVLTPQNDCMLSF